MLHLRYGEIKGDYETIIEGVKLTIRYNPRAINKNEMVVYRWNERLTLRFTDSVTEKITQLLKE